MSRMGVLLESRLDQNKYALYEACQRTIERLQAAFACNPDIDSAEVRVNYLYGIFESCRVDLERLIRRIEKGV